MMMSEQLPEGEKLTLSLTEVAELAGVRPGSVANWRKRHSDFPNPVIGPGRNRFLKDEIEEWLDSKGKRKKPTKETLNKAYQKIQKKIHPDISPETSRLSAIVNEAKEIVLKDIS